MGSTVIRTKDRADWLKQRELGIGSSEVATIIGLNPWETPYQLWRRKLGIDPPKEMTFAMKAGHYLEDAVAQFYQDESGREIIKSSAEDFLVVDDARPYLRVSPDRTFWTGGKKNSENKGIVELKTTQRAVDPDDLPKWWYTQLQYQMGVAGYRLGSLAWLSMGRDFGYVDLEFDSGFFGWLAEEVERFWVDYVQAQKEPPVHNVADMLIKYSRHAAGSYREVDEPIYHAWNDLKAVRAQIADLEEQKKELEDTIKLTFEEAEGITYQGEVLATWKAPKPSVRFDEKLFRQEQPAMWDQYAREAQGTRRFLVK